jgi:hypothetical protein
MSQLLIAPPHRVTVLFLTQETLNLPRLRWLVVVVAGARMDAPDVLVADADVREANCLVVRGRGVIATAVAVCMATVWIPA